MRVAVIVRMAVPMRMIMVVMRLRMISDGLQRRRIAMAVQGCPWQAVLLAKGFVPAGCVAVALARTVFQTAANAFDMVMVTFLCAT